MWSYKALLVHAERDGSSEARILLAADLADRFEATLIGLTADPLASVRDLGAAGRRFHDVSSRAARPPPAARMMRTIRPMIVSCRDDAGALAPGASG